MKLIIGNKNYSSWSLRAWLAAREGGFTFEEIRIPLFIPGSRERILSQGKTGRGMPRPYRFLAKKTVFDGEA